jgi:hypothetical protein
MKEIWKDIPGYEGLYQASNLGRIKSLKREINKVWNRFQYCNKPLKEKILKPDGSRYLQVQLCKNNKTTKYSIHRLVLKAFVGNSDLVCNHKDANPKNNRLDNLEYCTQKENVDHSWKMGHQHKGSDHGMSILNERQVRRIKLINKYCNLERGYWTKLAKSLGVNRTTIGDIRYNRTWKHILI